MIACLIIRKSVHCLAWLSNLCFTCMRPKPFCACVEAAR